MKTRTDITSTCDPLCKIPIYRNKLRGWLLMGAALLGVGITAQAANILINPGFEADGAHGLTTPAAGWTTTPAGFANAAYINSDSYAHSGGNYYKVWGQWNNVANTNNLSQDKGALATATYSADGWFFALPSDSLWSGDGANTAWLEVSFRDSGGNVLALYRSDLFNPTVGSIPYTTGTWYDLPVTNQLDPSTLLITNHTATLVAPAGTAAVRYNIAYKQLLYGGGSCYFDDETLNQLSGPVPPVIGNVYPGNMLMASNHISFTVSSPSSTPINSSGIHLKVNGTDVSGSATITPVSSSSYNVLYSGLAPNTWNYAASISVTDSVGLTASSSMAFDTVSTTNVWEAEDYDFTNGMYYDFPIISSIPQPNCYVQVTGTLGVDYQSSAVGHANYRTNDTTGTGSGDGVRQKYLTAQLTDSNAMDYVVGYIAVNDWFNYTRDIPAGNYNIYARLASGNGVPNVVSLDDYTVPGSPVNLGTFQVPNNGWGSYSYLPLVDGSGNLLQFSLSGKKTFRATLTTGGANMNFFMLMPAQANLPVISNLTPTNNALFYNGNFSFTASSASGINNSGVKLNLNGLDVSSGLVFSGPSTALDVSYSGLKSNTIYTAVFTVTNTVGSGLSRTVQFDTMSQNNFYVAIADFDYSSGQYDTANNGLLQNGYLAQNAAVADVDYHHGTTSGEQFNYRMGLATEVGTDFSLPGFLPQYDVGWFGYGDWGNYTRNYPAGKYLVYGRIAGYTQSDSLDQVTSGQGTTSQTLKNLGYFVCNPNGWASWIWVPLTDAGGAAPKVVTLNGVETLRLSSGNQCNANYFMLVPVTAINLTATRVGSGAGLSFPTQATKTYQIFYKTSLSSGNWLLLTTVTGDGTTKTVTDNAGSPRFYIVVGQ